MSTGIAVRASWDDQKDEIILRELLVQSFAGKRADSGFKSEAWVAVTAVYNSNFSPPLKKDQVKNRGSAVRLSPDTRPGLN